MKRSLTALAALVTVLGAHACNGAADDPRGTDTGNPYDDNGEGTVDNNNCSEEETELEPTEQTPLGFSADSVLQLAVGEHRQSLAWLDANVEYGPESGRSEIVLTVESLGTARFVDREVQTRSGEEEGETLVDIGVGDRKSVV